MLSSMGDQSPVIEAGGNVTVNYGLDEERVKAMLERQQEELFRKLRESGFAADDGERRLLEQQLQAVSAKLADIERSYEEELARRKAADAALAQLRGQLPEAQIENAQANLRQGDKDAAKSVFHGVLDKEGASVALAAYHLGQMAESDLNYAKAMRMYKKAVALEEDNPKYLFAAGNMARTMAEYKQAQEWLEHLLEIMKDEGDDVKIASAMNSLANLYVDQGKYKKAAPMYEHALSICENYFGKNSMSIICFLENIAILKEMQEKYDESEAVYHRIIKIVIKSRCCDKSVIATILHNLSQLYHKQKRFKLEKNICNIVLLIRKKMLGEKHIDTAGTMNNLANNYLCYGNHSAAEGLYQNIFAVYKKNFNINHVCIAETMNNLAGIYCIQEKYGESESMLLEAIRIFKEKFPDGHPRIELFQKNYDELKRKMARQG